MDEPAPASAEADQQARALCQALNAYGVSYVVFGSMAGRLLGVDLRTQDLSHLPLIEARRAELAGLGADQERPGPDALEPGGGRELGF